MSRKYSLKYKLPSVNYYKYHREREYSSGKFSTGSILRSKLAQCRQMHRHDLVGHFGCVNAIEFSTGVGEFIASGGDDRRILLWNVEETLSGLSRPRALQGHHNSNIFCVAFDNQNENIFSGGNDEQVVMHDATSGTTKDVFAHADAVYSICVDPVNSHEFASACDDGKVRIYDTRAPPSQEPFVLASYPSAMHAVVYNPVEPRLLATANAKEGLGLWDIRQPKIPLIRYGGSISQQSCMSVRISRCGQKLISLRRRLPPVLYNLHSPLPVYQFDHSGYYNSCTMKSCCFAGDNDEYLLSGSDDFKLYMWRIPDYPIEVPWIGSAHVVMEGHRSIVNQVRFNPSRNLIISSGVEKSIKMWAPFRIPLRGTWSDRSSESERPVYTHEEYINLVLHSGHIMSHDQTQQTTSEDPRMMAFFDSLVQRELEGWSSDENSENNSEVLQREAPLSNSSSSQSDDEIDSYSPFTLRFASSILANEISSDNSDDAELNHIHTIVSELRSSDHTVQHENPNNQSLPVNNHDGLPNAPWPASSQSRSNDEQTLMPGQQPLASRQRISELISQKRKEYLTNAKKAALDARRKSRKMLKTHEQMSSSDEDEPPRKKSTQLPCVVNEGASTSQVSDIVNTTSVQSKRLKQIKQRLQQEDSDPPSAVAEQLEVGSTNTSTCTSPCKSENHTNYSAEQGPHLSKDIETPSTSAPPSANVTNADAPVIVENTANGTEQRTTWAAFKRFKHKVERARRQYRQNSQDTSSGSEQ